MCLWRHRQHGSQGCGWFGGQACRLSCWISDLNSLVSLPCNNFQDLRSETFDMAMDSEHDVLSWKGFMTLCLLCLRVKPGLAGLADLQQPGTEECIKPKQKDSQIRTDRMTKIERARGRDRGRAEMDRERGDRERECEEDLYTNCFCS